MELKDLLHSLGYHELRDDGSYWRTRAIYRDGDNKTSLRINKVTGRFDDFVERISGDIDDLVILTTGVSSEDLGDFYHRLNINPETLVTKREKPKIVMEKTWNMSELANLMPHFKFYENRGISADTLRFFKSGFAHSGSMNERFVFPIFRKDGLIHGWSGRDMTGRKEAKWKHIGRKSKWLYPVYVPKTVVNTDGTPLITFPCLEAIMRTGEVILVESHGDMLAHWERGVYNVIVTFGLTLSPALGAFLMSAGLKRIIIALNNDFSSNKNRGKIAAIDMFIDLLSYVDFDKIFVVLPKTNDFGDMKDEEYEEWQARKAKVNVLPVYAEVLDKLRYLYQIKEITKDQVKLGTAIKERYEEIKANQAESVSN